ncbi:GCN5-related N-acetyltransferase 3, chloroplastic isoform X2 [Musa acuminata AAA Group]|uniref:GCN5-related N-acetyltransferase 3, chloroplastic isoform X2 n=1 Tax=Musa acuminata AAA Group TaxID=214697 RepID=UPI0031DF1BEB
MAVTCATLPSRVSASASASASACFPFSYSLNPSLNPQPKARKPPPPITISANPSHVDPFQLRDLLAAANHSCHRFPALTPDGRAESADPEKLRVALHHSSVVVSVFCRSKFLAEDGCGEGRYDVSPFTFEKLFDRVMPAERDRRLVGFGRAVSDGGLTASIHDVVVVPSLQGRGIGRKIVERITRIITGRGIYDISALCSENESLFFKACGFGEDCLGSTTMMYTRTATGFLTNNQAIQPAGGEKNVHGPTFASAYL